MTERPCQWIGEHLPWYLNNTLEADEADRVREHLTSCANCQAELEECQWAFGLNDQHIPRDLMEKQVTGLQVQEVASKLLVETHLQNCATCRDTLNLMKASWNQIQNVSDSEAMLKKGRGRHGTFIWVASFLAALLVVALGFGWWSTRQELNALILIVDADLNESPLANFVTKDLFADERSRRSDAVASVRLFTGYQGVVLTLHSQIPKARGPFRLEVRSQDDRELWATSQVLAQENGLVSLVLPSSFLGGGPLSLVLTSKDEQWVEHYQFHPASQ